MLYQILRSVLFLKGLFLRSNKSHWEKVHKKLCVRVYGDAGIEKYYSSNGVYAKDVSSQLVLAKVQYFKLPLGCVQTHYSRQKSCCIACLKIFTVILLKNDKSALI